MISGSAMLTLLVYLVVGGLVCFVLWWFISFIGLPEPFNKVAKVIVALVAVIFLINILLSLTGTPLFRW